MARSRKLARHSTNLFQRFTLKPASAGFACIDSQKNKKIKNILRKKEKKKKKGGWGGGGGGGGGGGERRRKKEK